MSLKSLSTAALLSALLAAGCEMTFRPDAGQAATTTGPATATAPATARGEGRGGAEGRGAATAPGRGRGATVPNNLEAAMSEMNRMLTALKAEATDPAKAEQTLRDLATFQRDVAICKTLTPPTNRIAADERAKAVDSYRAMMNGLIRTAMDMEDAVTEKKPDEIKKGLEQLAEIEKQGHTEFKVGND